MKRKANADAAMTRRSMFIADDEWAMVVEGRKRTVLGSDASFVRACIRAGAASVVKKYSRK